MAGGEIAGLFATDVDGTLLDGDSIIPEKNIQVLQSLGEKGVVRVVATGRSVETARRVLRSDLPIDYLVFSSGAGICNWPEGRLQHENHMLPEDALAVLSILRGEGLSFMAQRPIPRNHEFFYEVGAAPLRGDFFDRLEAYRDLAKPLARAEEALSEGLSQFIVTIPGDEALYCRLRALVEHRVDVIRATSPFDGHSIWMELFPKGVSKGNAIEWLCDELGVAHERVCVVGNDYNDLSMLRHFPRHAYVVANSPVALREEFRVVASCDTGGMAQAASLWWAEMESRG